MRARGAGRPLRAMGIVETQAVVIQTFKLADADKIAVCMTEKSGLIRGVAHGARRLKSKFGASLEPFTLIRLTYFEKESRELVTIKESEILKSYFDAAKDAEVVRALGYLAELVKEFAPPHQPDEKLFKMLRACIEATANNPNLLQAITVYTELWTLKLTGLLPGARECGSCGARLGVQGAGVYISPEGALRCQSCRQAGWQRISAEEHELLASMRVQGPKDWAETFKATSDGGRQSVSDIAGRLVRRALEREPRASRSAHTATRTNGGEINE